MAERKMKIREAARIAGVSPATISAWCSDGSPEDYIAVKKLAKALNVSFAFLLTGEEDSKAFRDAPSIAEVFDESGELFNGYAKIVIMQMVPRHQKKDQK